MRILQNRICRALVLAPSLLLNGMVCAEQDAPAAGETTVLKWHGHLATKDGDSLEVSIELERCESPTGRLEIEHEKYRLRCQTWNGDSFVFSFGAPENEYRCPLLKEADTGGYRGSCAASDKELGDMLLFPTGSAAPTANP